MSPSIRTLLLPLLLPALLHAAPEPGKIALIGDSITQGAGYAVNGSTFPQNGNRSWRWEFFKRLVDAGADFDFVGSLTTNHTNSGAGDDVTNSYYPSWRGVPFDRDHEGHWGWRASQVRGTSAGPSSGKRGAGNLADWLVNYTPDSAVIMIGINDLNDSGATPASLAEDVSVLVDLLQADNPSVVIHLCELLHVGPNHPNRQSLNTAVDIYNTSRLPLIAAAKTTGASVVRVVDMHNPVWNGTDWVPQAGGWDPAVMTYDDVHPNGNGEAHVGKQVARDFGLLSRWTDIPVVNGNFEGAFPGTGTAACRPEGWTVFGAPNPSAIPKRLGDFSVVSEGSVETGTGSAGSSYIIAGPADTGIAQTTLEPVSAGEIYQLQVLVYKASSQAGPGDYAAEMRVGGSVVAAIPVTATPTMYVTGSGTQIGRSLTEFTASFRADDFPNLIGQPIEIRLMARNNLRYIGFEGVRLSRRAEDEPGKVLKLFVLTGQSNALGTLATSDTAMLRDAPGTHAAEQAMNVPFFWDNRADGTPAGDAGLGDSGGAWVNLGAQGGGYYAGNDDHWGPEIGFARMLWNAGYRDFGIVKATRGGGGNSYWVKDSADDHMYDHVVATVNAAVVSLPPGFSSHEVAGLLYVQGESNDATEAGAADTRFDGLLTNLKVELSNASALKGVFGEIGGGSTTNRDLTRARQRELAAARADVGYAYSTGMTMHDGLHYVADSQLLLGERMAAEMIAAGAVSAKPLPAWSNLYAWFVPDNGAQPEAGGPINRWASLNNGSGLRDLTRTVNGWPSTRSVAAADGQPRKVVRFAGKNDLWASSSEFGTLADERSVAILCRVTDAADGFLFDGATSSGRTRGQVRGGNWQAGVSVAAWDEADTVTAARSLNDWQRHVFIFDDVAGGTSVKHWVNGIQVGSHDDAGISGLRGLILGSNGGSVFRPLACDVAEVAVYDKVLDAAEVAELDAAWTVRWGTPVGPPFGVSTQQSPREVPRFGKHALVRVTVDSPTSGATVLDGISITLKGMSRGRISGISVIGTGSSGNFDPSATILASAGRPVSNRLGFTLHSPLVEGANHFWITVDPERWAELGGTIDATVDELVFSGANAGTVVPGDGDPPGELVLALVPYETDVRVRGQGGVPDHRIPGIACDGAGVLHAVFDHRYSNSAGAGGNDLPGDIDVGYARSTDGGATWSGKRAILDFDATVPGSSGNGVGDPCILWDPATDTLWVAALWSFGSHGYNGSGPGTAPSQTGQLVLTKSTDGGETWSAPINITADVKDDPNWNLVFQGPGHGLVMRDGTLVFPAQYRDGTLSNDGVNQVRSCSIFSSDHGATWDFGSAVPSTNPQTNEMTLCELDDGRLLFSCRTPSGSNGQRAWAHYSPGGATPMRDGTWDTLYRLPSVPDPVCQGSVIQWKSTFKGHPREMILFANPATGGRNGMTLRVSMDGGLTWPVSRLVDSGASAYSSLCILPDHSIGLLYEKDNYHSISFVRVEEGWLFDPDADGDGDGLPDSWESLWGANPGFDDAGGDGDGDGMTNAQEYQAGTDPRDGRSLLRATEFKGIEGKLSFSWQSVSGRAYQVEESEGLDDWASLGLPVVATGARSGVLISDDGSRTRRFIRVRVLR